MLGLENKMDHKPWELSGGEQQRVAIARAVINRPAILLADEPTGSLDSENSRMVLKMLRDLNSEYGQTIIIITHDPEAAATADRVIEMRDGKILNRVQNMFYAVEEKRS
jgi:putative ABC transport system ATP-binding protein